MWMTQKKRTALARRMPAELRALFRIGCATGLRISELLKLEWFMADPKSKAMNVLIAPRAIMKGKKQSRWIQLERREQKLMKKLDDHKSERIFRMARSTAARLLRKYAKIAPHDMRRIFATDAYHALHDVILTGIVLGHADPRNTVRYIHKTGVKDLWSKLKKHRNRKAH